MDILNKMLEYINGTQIASASYKPTTPYTGKLPINTVKKGSEGRDVKRVKNFLNWCLGTNFDIHNGTCGKKTVKAIKKFEKRYKLKPDGVFGTKCRRKARQIVKKHKPKPAPTDPMEEWYKAMEDQFYWSRNQKYEYNPKPTVANSKKKGTCNTFPSVSLQRIGLLPSGKFFYYHPKHNRISGNGASYVKKHPEIFDLSYPHKTIEQLLKEGKIKKGDIVGYDDPAYHMMVFMGVNSEGEYIFNTMGHTRKLMGTYPYYAHRKVDMIVHLKKV